MGRENLPMVRNLLPVNPYPCSSLYPRPTLCPHGPHHIYPRPSCQLSGCPSQYYSLPMLNSNFSTHAQLSTLNSLSTLDSLQCYHRFPIHAQLLTLIILMFKFSSTHIQIEYALSLTFKYPLILMLLATTLNQFQ